MSQSVLEEIKKESESLYQTVVKAAGKKWNVDGFERVSADFCFIRVSKIKKPDKTMKLKCVLHNAKWFLVGE
jgi:hypothetical protein